MSNFVDGDLATPDLFNDKSLGASTVRVTGDDTDRSTRATAVQNAIDEAENEGKDFVFVPSNFGPGTDGYDASSVNFNGSGGTWSGRLVREGQVADVYDVKVYGAAGDGSTNDAPAVQAAHDAVTNQSLSSSEFGGSAGAGRAPIVYYPPGDYLLDAQVTDGQRTTIVGDAANIMQGTNVASTTALYALGGWLGTIRGLTFADVDRPLSIDTTNLDQGTLEIERCHFGGAIEAVELSTGSSIVSMRNCRWDNCETVLTMVQCDEVYIHDSWMSLVAKSTNEAVSIQKDSGQLHLIGVDVIPASDSASRVALVENNVGSLFFLDSRMGGESGGLCLVNNRVQADTTADASPHGIFVRDSVTWASDTVIRLFELPNVLMLRNCKGFATSTGIDFSSTVTPSTVVSNAGGINTKKIVDVYGNEGDNVESASFIHSELQANIASWWNRIRAENPAAFGGVDPIDDVSVVAADTGAGTFGLEVIRSGGRKIIQVGRTSGGNDVFTYKDNNENIVVQFLNNLIGFFGNTAGQQGPLTAQDSSTVDATYGTEEEGVIKNNRTRVSEIETALQNYGLLS